MISGVQKALISGWYTVDILDVCLLDSVKTYLFSAIFQVFYSLTPVHWCLANIKVYPADNFQYSAGTCQICKWSLVNFLLISVYYTSDIWLISWYSVYRFPARCYPLFGMFFGALPGIPFPKPVYLCSLFGTQGVTACVGVWLRVILFPFQWKYGNGATNRVWDEGDSVD